MQSKVEEVLLCSIPSQRVYPVSFQAPLPWPILHWPAPLLVIRMWSQAIRLPGSARSGSFCIVHCLHHRRNPTFLVSSVPPAAAAGTWDGSWGWTPLAKNLAFLRHLRILVRCTSSQELAWQEHLHRASAQKQGLLGYSSNSPQERNLRAEAGVVNKMQLALDYLIRWDYISISNNEEGPWDVSDAKPSLLLGLVIAVIRRASSLQRGYRIRFEVLQTATWVRSWGEPTGFRQADSSARRPDSPTGVGDNVS